MPNIPNTATPALQISQWFNTNAPLSLETLRGRVVVLHAFQMLCPACVAHGIPQAMRIHQFFTRDNLVVLGLHTVFEHHTAMTPTALQAFLHEYRVVFPVGVDLPVAGSSVPATMQAYGLRGTPSLVVLDRMGVARFSHFGTIDDLQLGALLGTLVCETGADNQPPPSDQREPYAASFATSTCDDGQCAVKRSTQHPT